MQQIHEKPLTGMLKLSGIIQNLTTTHAEANFFFTQADKHRFGAVAIASAAAGLGAEAVLMASYATSMEEKADYIEFELEEKLCKGWVWRSPFDEGDQVNIACEWQEDHYEIYAVARPSDRLIALYPHCSRGKLKHIHNAVKWWIYTNIIFNSLLLLILFITAYNFENGQDIIIYGFMCFGINFAIIIWSMIRQWQPFVHLAEKCFRVLELPNPSNIDLVASSLGKSWGNNPLYIVGETIFFCNDNYNWDSANTCDVAIAFNIIKKMVCKS